MSIQDLQGKVSCQIQRTSSMNQVALPTAGDSRKVLVVCDKRQREGEKNKMTDVIMTRVTL